VSLRFQAAELIVAQGLSVVIRADASHVIGSGHVMRSLTLADGLRAAGVGVRFIARAHLGHLGGLLRSRGFEVVLLDAAPAEIATTATDPVHAAWVGASWQEDARDTRAAIAALPAVPDWLIVDHYGLDARWEQALRSSVGRILVIDDLADRAHECDLLLDQNLFADSAERYRGKLPAQCLTLFGPEYALLQPAYEQLHGQVAARVGAVRRVLIYFGGTDGGEYVTSALRAFLSLERSDMVADVVTGGSGVAAVAELARGHDNVTLHGQLPSLAALMAEAQLAVGAAGATTWERMCLGLPALVISLADNQRAVADALFRRGYINWLGHRDEVSFGDLRDALGSAVARGADTQVSRACRNLVDGRGVRRVCAALLLDAGSPLVLRQAGAQDEALLLAWANDQSARRASFGRAAIDAEEHHQWFTARLRDADDCLLLICQMQNGVPIGTVRFDRIAGGWRLNYSLGHTYRGRKVARRMVELALLELRRTHGAADVVAQVMSGNAPSHAVLRSVGFTVRDATPDLVDYHCAL
jgi:UDP-2,4-diacetamido-2,4,6-trideoxy-beta-L-altropyranose hydrolase